MFRNLFCGGYNSTLVWQNKCCIRRRYAKEGIFLRHSHLFREHLQCGVDAITNLRRCAEFGRRHEDKTADQSTAILRSQNMDLIRLLFWLPSCSDMRMVDAGAVESGPFGRGVAFEQNKRRISNFEDMSK